MNILKKLKKCVKHEIGIPEYIHRTNSYILERGSCIKCGKRGQFETVASGSHKEGTYKESKKWTSLGA